MNMLVICVLTCADLLRLEIMSRRRGDLKHIDEERSRSVGEVKKVRGLDQFLASGASDKSSLTPDDIGLYWPLLAVWTTSSLC